jgi:hypothetical protein
VYASAYSIGLTFGPYAYEKPLVDGGFSSSLYFWPIFIGGIYHKKNLSEKWFYYTDLAFSIHRSDIAESNYNGRDYETKIIDVNSYFFYLHNDINWYPFDKKWAFVGTGIEAIIVARAPAEPVGQDRKLASYTTMDFFCYVDIGASIPVGPVEIGLKTLYRLSPFAVNDFRTLGNGELSFFVGLKP